MQLLIQPDYDRLCDWAAAYVARQIVRAALQGRPYVLGLPTGSTPLGVYARWVRWHREGRLSMRHVVTFNMDEYVGLGADHPQSYRSYMRHALWDHVDLAPENVHIPDGNAPDLAEECAAYEERIRRAGGIRLFLAGLGHDGHIAFNEPGSSLASRTRVVTLTEDTRRANARFFGGDIEQVPRQAITVGVGTVMDADEVLLLVSGRSKAPALHHVVEQGVNHMWTASALQWHPHWTVVCDQDAAAELRAETVRYFLDVHRAELAPPSW